MEYVCFGLDGGLLVRRWFCHLFRAANDGTIMNLSTYVLYVLTPLLESVLGRDRVVMLKYMYGSSSRYLGGKEHGSLRVVVGDACT